MPVKQILEKFPPKKEYLVDILYAIQMAGQNKSLTREQLNAVAKYLKLAKAQVFGVATFYDLFRIESNATYHVRICNSVSCSLKDSDGLYSEFEKLLESDNNSGTNEISLDKCNCTGHCYEAPVIVINNVLHKNITPAKLKVVYQTIKKL